MLEAAKQAAQWRSGSLDDSALFAGAPGVYLVLRNARGDDAPVVLRGGWTSAPDNMMMAGGDGTRTFERVLALYERTWLYVERTHAR
jgi:hypothetical protein